MTAKTVAEGLAGRVRELCQHLLPSGKEVGQEWVVGSVAGEAGQSLKVRLSGQKAGLWADFATSDAGDALDLWAKVRGIHISDAMREAKEWLGIREQPEKVREYTKPKMPASVTPMEQDVLNYLTIRRLSKEAIEAYRVGTAGNRLKPEDRWIVLPSYDIHGELVQVKYIGLVRDENGKKRVRTAKEAAPALFGWQAIPKLGRQLIITEGEVDAMSWATLGYPAVSVPFGAVNFDWIDYEWDRLEAYTDIVLSFDSDKPGQEAANHVAHRLGLHRCRILEMPKGFKDCNEWLAKLSPRREHAAELLDGAKHITPREIVELEEWRDRALAFLFPEGGVEVGDTVPFLGKNLMFRPSECSLWTGVTSHGKSTLLSHAMLDLANQDRRITVASMEVAIHVQMAKMAVQWNGGPIADKAAFDRFMRWIAGRIYFLNLRGNVALNHILQLFTYSRARHGCTHFVLDSLMKTDVPNDDYEKQRIATNMVTDFAIANECHLHMVAHPRKADDEGHQPGKLDVKGSSDVVNQPDNIIAVWRNRKKEQREQKGEKNINEPDTIVFVEKQRMTGWEGRIKLLFDKPSTQFMREGPLARPTIYHE